MLELFGSMAWFQESIPGVRFGVALSATVLMSLVSNGVAEKLGVWLRARLTAPLPSRERSEWESARG